MEIALEETEARGMGWVPKEEFKGDESKWIEADKFIERGKTILPILNERLKKYEGTIAGLNNKITDMTETFGEYQKRQMGLEERAYKKALSELTAAQKQAVKDGDEAAFDAAEKAKAELEAPVAPTVKETKAEKREFEAWQKENKWFLDDKELQAYATSILGYVQNRDQLPDGITLYDAVKEEVKLRFPEKFENKARKQPSTVVGGGDTPPPKGERTFTALPKEAQAQCKRFEKTIPGFTKEMYLNDYEWEK